MKGFIPWPGGKGTAATALIEMFPSNCRLYCEPFMGAASVFWNLPEGAFEQHVLNDLNDDLVNLFNMVRDRSEDMAKIYKWMIHSRKTFAEMLKVRKGELSTGHDRDIERAIAYFYLLKTGHNTCPKSPGNFRSGKQEIKSMFNADFDLEPYRRKLKNCVVETMDFEILMRRYDKADAFFYTDPPYVDVGDVLYEKFFTEDDHRRLAETMKDLKGRWMLSYNEHPLVRELYKKYKIMEASWCYHSKVGKIDTDEESLDNVELVILNYDPSEAVGLFAQPAKTKPRRKKR